MALLRRLYNWVLSWADTPWGSPALFVIAFAESSFFPIPPDVLQVALSAGRHRLAFFYATISLAGSLLGAVAGYMIGWLCWQTTQEFFFAVIPGMTPQVFDYVQEHFHANAFLAIWLSAFTPIPYKVFTIAAGVANVPIITLLAASLLGRGMRFFLVATLMFFFGPAMRDLIDRHFDRLALLFGVLLVAGFVVIKLLL